VLYGSNTFAAHPSCLTGLPYLVTRAKPVTHGRGKAMIKRWYINIRLDTDPGFDREKVADAFSGAEELEVEAFQSMYGSCDYSVLELFEDVRDVGRVKISGSIGDGRYARWLERVMVSKVGEEVGRYEDLDVADGGGRVAEDGVRGGWKGWKSGWETGNIFHHLE